jgi:hypothetical protein
MPVAVSVNTGGRRRPRHLEPDRARDIEADIARRVSTDPGRALVQAKAAYRDARQHKANIQREQRRLAMEMFRFEVFRCELEARGIKVVIEPGPMTANPTYAEGGASDPSSEGQSPAV